MRNDKQIKKEKKMKSYKSYTMKQEVKPENNPLKTIRGKMLDVKNDMTLTMNEKLRKIKVLKKEWNKEMGVRPERPFNNYDLSRNPYKKGR